MTQEEILYLLECAQMREDLAAGRAWSEAGDIDSVRCHEARANALEDAIAIIKSSGPSLVPDEDDDGYPLIMKRWGKL